MACPQCGSEILTTVAAHYMREVRKPGADPQVLDPLAPPSRKALLHGVIFGFFAWAGFLAPFFAPEGAMLRTSLPFWVLTVVWAPIFWIARARDRGTRADYEARAYCENCGWHQ